MVNDLGNDPYLLAAFELLMKPKVPGDAKDLADRAEAMAFLLEAKHAASRDTPTMNMIKAHTHPIVWAAIRARRSDAGRGRPQRI
jgi:hypothetical protein